MSMTIKGKWLKNTMQQILRPSVKLLINFKKQELPKGGRKDPQRARPTRRDGHEGISNDADEPVLRWLLQGEPEKGRDVKLLGLETRTKTLPGLKNLLNRLSYHRHSVYIPDISVRNLDGWRINGVAERI
ncbi:unnamed protein product [Allacma fusca]|uniref:Uncharacterized protein n=1 Tax=Allacma fusca TaxID=39272 RepID=A0A8J2P0E5_9HEXA|nr:unnamed protein product [Allacma fusca]